MTTSMLLASCAALHVLCWCFWVLVRLDLASKQRRLDEHGDAVANKLWFKP